MTFQLGLWDWTFLQVNSRGEDFKIHKRREFEQISVFVWFYLDLKMDLPGRVSLVVVSRTRVTTSILRVNIGDGEGVVETDTGTAVSTVSSLNNNIALTNNIPLHHSLLIARQGPAE